MLHELFLTNAAFHRLSIVELSAPNWHNLSIRILLPKHMIKTTIDLGSTLVGERQWRPSGTSAVPLETCLRSPGICLSSGLLTLCRVLCTGQRNLSPSLRCWFKPAFKGLSGLCVPSFLPSPCPDPFSTIGDTLEEGRAVNWWWSADIAQEVQCKEQRTDSPPRPPHYPCNYPWEKNTT